MVPASRHNAVSFSERFASQRQPRQLHDQSHGSLRQDAPTT